MSQDQYVRRFFTGELIFTIGPSEKSFTALRRANQPELSCLARVIGNTCSNTRVGQHL
jgi:hypothetical protein